MQNSSYWLALLVYAFTFTKSLFAKRKDIKINLFKEHVRRWNKTSLNKIMKFYQFIFEYS
jgi:hypothetical protein